MQPDKTIRISLVHGTFSANAEWVNQSEQNPESFKATLRSAMSCDIEYLVPPPWGASNFFGKVFDLTNKARLNGAERLKKHILDQPLGNQQKHILLTHSHGGNVAMYALQDLDVRQRVDGLICMATPFLYPRQRPLSIATLVLSIVIMMLGMVQFVAKMDLLNGGAMAWSIAVALMMVAAVVPTFLVWVVAKERYKRRILGDAQLDDHIEQLSYQDPQVPILLIRSSGDEASGLLRGAQFVNWLAGLVMKIGGRQLYTLLCIGALVFLWMGYQNTDWMPDTILAFLNAALMGSAAIMVIMLIALSFSRISVGLDAWRWVGELETMVEDGPPGIKSELIVIQPRHPKHGLSHTGVYTEKETIDAIALWCKR